LKRITDIENSIIFNMKIELKRNIRLKIEKKKFSILRNANFISGFCSYQIRR